MQVRVAELRELCDSLLGHLEANGVEQIEIGADLYWNVPADQRYAPYQEPHTLDIGSLAEDWRELQCVRAGESDPLAYHLVWLSSILRAVGETVMR
jgi:hypothetical protein